MAATAPAWIREKLRVFTDPLFRFDPEPHLYYYGTRELVSVTTWVKDYKGPFDREGQAAISAFFRQCPVEDVLAEWDYSNVLGTNVHSYAEAYLLAGMNITRTSEFIPQDHHQQERCTKFVRFAVKHLKDFVPVAVELRVFLLELGLAGTLDALLWHVPTQTLWVFDWKTNSKLRTNKTRRTDKRLFAPFDGFYDHEHNVYSIQLAWYRRILAYYGIPTAGGVLVHIPPDEQPAYMLKAYDMIPLLEEHFPLIA